MNPSSLPTIASTNASSRGNFVDDKEKMGSNLHKTSSPKWSWGAIVVIILATSGAAWWLYRYLMSCYMARKRAISLTEFEDEARILLRT